MSRIAPLLVLSLTAILAHAQVLSPRKTTSVTVDGKKITVGFGSPSARGRKVMGGLVPYNEVWCAGANDATSLDTEADLMIGTMKVPKGSYTLWTLPNPNEWLLIVNKETGQWHTEYDSSRDFGRVKMNIKTVPEPVEQMRFQLTSAGGKNATLALAWENTEVSVPITILK